MTRMTQSLAPNIIRSKLMNIISDMKQHPEGFVMNPGRDFTRNRRLPFEDTILLTMNMQTSSLDGEIANFWFARHPENGNASNPLYCPTKSAFVHQRGKLTDKTFPEILRRFNQAVPVSSKFKGYHCIAIDGTDQNIPRDTSHTSDNSTFISYNSGKGGYHQLHINVMYHLGDNRYLDAIVQPRALINEKDAAVSLIRCNPMTEKCIFIMDRGFDAFYVMAVIFEQNQSFLIRIKEADRPKSPFAFLINSRHKNLDVTTEFFFTRSKKSLPGIPRQQHKYVASNRRFDPISPDDKHSVFRLPIRFVKLTLDNGSVEYLATNLPASEFSRADLKNLYHRRWGVETSFLFLKYGIALNHPHSIRRRFQIQEIFASLILYNFISMIIACTKPSKATVKYKYQVNHSNAIRLCRRFLIMALSSSVPDLAILDMISRSPVPVRKDKDRPRVMRSQRLNSLQNRA